MKNAKYSSTAGMKTKRRLTDDVEAAYEEIVITFGTKNRYVQF